jgi:Domain of unknown function (DUF4157)/IPT/TIG domain
MINNMQKKSSIPARQNTENAAMVHGGQSGQSLFFHSISQPNDACEQQADTMADKVMRMADNKKAGQSFFMPAPVTVQRKCQHCEDEEEKKLQRKEINSENAEPLSQSENYIGSLSGGKGLSKEERSFFEPAMNHDFGNVRLHTDKTANKSAENLNALAYTYRNNIVFGDGQYQPHTENGKRLMAHELTHVIQQGSKGPGVQRWAVGAAPVPVAGWSVITDPEHLRRLGQAETIVRGVLTSRNCRNFFRDNCTNGDGINALQNAFDNAQVYFRPEDDNVFGIQSGTSHNIAYNQRSFRIGRFMMASTLLHEMFHTCDPTMDATDELEAENAVEACRLHTPWIDNINTSRGAVGSNVTITGWGFGATPGPTDSVRIGGVAAPVTSWAFLPDNSSRVRIVAEVPAGAGMGGVVVINNGVESNVAAFTVI